MDNGHEKRFGFFLSFQMSVSWMNFISQICFGFFVIYFKGIDDIEIESDSQIRVQNEQYVKIS